VSLRAEWEKFQAQDTLIFGISVDSRFSLNQFASSLGGLPFPLLADFHPKGEVAQLYDVWNEKRGQSRRACFIIDKAGTIRFSKIYPPGQLPTSDELLTELEKF